MLSFYKFEPKEESCGIKRGRTHVEIIAYYELDCGPYIWSARTQKTNSKNEIHATPL
jgi:hypothetical protein